MVNTIAPSIILALILLAAAIAATWAGAIRAGRIAISPWLIPFIAASCGAYAAGILQPAGALALAISASCAQVWRNSANKAARLVSGIVLLLAIFALGTHKLPGFDNPIVIAAQTLSPGAPPFTQYANFDKGAAGLILLALACRKSGTSAQWRITLQRALPIGAITVIAVLGTAMATAYVRLDPKFNETAAIFITVNLFFTVVAEEALFRGFIQQQLTDMAGSTKPAAAIAAFVSAVLFGAAHVGGGATFAALATLAGFGYAWAYQASGRIEAPILVHCVVNAIHFTCFTYPYLIEAR
ncbi:MAG TPA: CPBP family intramembrane glutamic endopeptidase [Burkholderiaceae bacterium]